MMYVRLKSGGYRLIEDWWVESPRIAGCAARAGTSGEIYVSQDESGRMTLRRGYQWDGPSGPTIDTRDFMPGSLAHDGGYQLGRGGHVPSDWRQRYDRLLYDVCRSHGMGLIRATWVYWGVRLGGASSWRRAAEPEDKAMQA